MAELRQLSPIMQVRDVHGFPEYKSITLHMGRETCHGRTEEEDKKYHAAAVMVADQIKDLIAICIWAYHCVAGPGWGHPKAQMISYRIALWAAINAAISRLHEVAFENDALTVEEALRGSVEHLWGAIGRYLDEHFSEDPKDTCCLQRSAVFESYRRGKNPFYQCYVKLRDPNAPARQELDQRLRNLLMTFPGISSASSSSVLKQFDASRVPPNMKNAGIVYSALAALPDEFAEDYSLWFKVACAVHHFDEGQIGLGLFKNFSARCPGKSTKTDFDGLWSNLARGYTGRPITLGSLIHWAKQYGWKQRLPSDRTPVSLGSRS
jgi:hypothetical protein